MSFRIVSLLLGVEVQPRQKAVGQFHALHRMLAGAPRLARVVQQQRQQKQIQPVDLRQQLRQPLLVVVRRLPQPVHVVDGQKRVLVHGVAVIAVADHQRIDAVELRNQHLQHAQRVHRAQRMRGVRSQQHLAQRIPQVRPLGNRDGQHRQRIGNAVFGRLRQRVAVRGHQREDAQDGCGVVELRSGLDVDASLVEQEIGSRDGRAPPPELAIEAHRRRQMLHQQRRAAINHARVPVIGAHPVGGIGRAARLQADRSRRGLVLRLPVERVVVAPVAEMQKTSRRRQKIERRFRIAARALEDSAALPRPLLGFLQMKQNREPHREMIVAQSAGAIFQVRFQMKDGVAVLRVPRAGNLAQLLRDCRSTRSAPGRERSTW